MILFPTLLKYVEELSKIKIANIFKITPNVTNSINCSFKNKSNKNNKEFARNNIKYLLEITI